MELRRVQPALGVLHRRDRADVGVRGDDEAVGHLGHGIAMAHPHGLLLRRVREQPRIGARTRNLGRSVLALVGVPHRAAKRHSHGLLPVAEAEHGNAQLEDGRIHAGRVLGIDARRTTRQDDRRRRQLAHLVGRDVAGYDFGVNPQVTNASGDELPVLRSKIQHDDQLLWGCGRGHERPPRRCRMYRMDSTPSPAATVFREREMSRRGAMLPKMPGA